MIKRGIQTCSLLGMTFLAGTVFNSEMNGVQAEGHLANPSAPSGQEIDPTICNCEAEAVELAAAEYDLIAAQDAYELALQAWEDCNGPSSPSGPSGPGGPGRNSSTSAGPSILEK